MSNKRISTGVVHRVPADLRDVLISASGVQKAWNDLTPLARNEWICWVTSAKKPETRMKRIERTHDELIEGKTETVLLGQVALIVKICFDY